jgi:endonuclease/exonuclease/phosphatase family metal-dependent hydrolase
MQIEVQSPDITAMKISNNDRDLYAFNIYLDQLHSDALFEIDRTVRDIKRTHAQNQRPAHLLWAGDFNQHSPLWDEERNHHLFTRANTRKAQVLIDRLATYDLKMLLPQGIPTLQAMATKNYMWTDNVFISNEIMDTCSRCTTLTQHRPPKTDHLPVVWDLDLMLERRPIRQ